MEPRESAGRGVKGFLKGFPLLSIRYKGPLTVYLWFGCHWYSVLLRCAEDFEFWLAITHFSSHPQCHGTS